MEIDKINQNDILDMSQQVTLFGNFENVDNEKIINILDKFKDYQFGINTVPGNITSLPEIENAFLQLNNFYKFKLDSLIKKISIVIFFDRVVIHFLDYNIYNKETINILLTEFVGAFLGIIQSEKICRLSFIFDKTIKINSEKIKSISKKYFEKIPYYNKNTPFEWLYNCFSRENFILDGNCTDINVGMTVSKQISELMNFDMINNVMQSIKEDSVRTMWDINTVPSFSEKQYSIMEIIDFVSQAIDKKNQIEQEDDNND